EIRQAAFRRAAVVKRSNVRVFECREYFAFGVKSAQKFGRIEFAADYLERGLSSVQVIAFGKVNGTHSAAAEFFDQFVIADNGTRFVTRDESRKRRTLQRVA